MDGTRTITADGVELHCEVSDSIDDHTRPLAVCVHGFPDTPFTWRHLAPELEAAGFRVAAPFLRAYAPSTVPTDGCLQTAASSLDVIAVHEALGGDGQAVLVGHDWGAPIVYGAANHAPERWSRVVGLAVPPGPALGHAFLNDTDQLKRSWYMFFFQNPLADMIVPAHDLAFIDMIWADWSPGLDASNDLVAVKAALREPANLQAALGYYRAQFSGLGVRDDLAEVQQGVGQAPPQPTLYLHGEHDGCIGRSVADSAAALIGERPADAPLTIEIVPDAAHFLHLDAPAVVNDRILEFLT